jgi:hypothetical protein
MILSVARRGREGQQKEMGMNRYWRITGEKINMAIKTTADSERKAHLAAINWMIENLPPGCILRELDVPPNTIRWKK